MSVTTCESGVQELAEVFNGFLGEVTTMQPLVDSPLREPLLSRVERAISAGMAALRSDQFRALRSIVVPENWGPDAFLANTIQQELGRNDNSNLRWLLVSYGIVLSNFDLISTNLEALAQSDPND